jgi:hypothetical protein
MSERWQFDIKKDLAVIEAGGFFCAACIVGKPAAEQSSDPRYCQNCYEIIQNVTPTGAFVPWMLTVSPRTALKRPQRLLSKALGL